MYPNTAPITYCLLNACLLPIGCMSWCHGPSSCHGCSMEPTMSGPKPRGLHGVGPVPGPQAPGPWSRAHGSHGVGLAQVTT